MSKASDYSEGNEYGLKEEMLLAAVAARASDIHIDPLSDGLLIRFRIDGILQSWIKTDISWHDPLISQMKALAELDITRRAIPHDGHFSWTPAKHDRREHDAHDGKQQERERDRHENKTSGKTRVLDIRLSVVPTVYGEAAVLRLLNRSDILLNLEDLGLDHADLAAVRKLVTVSQGMVLVTGPTSSGKTTTIYSILSELANANQNIFTLEDPVEYYLDMVRQSQIDPSNGYTYEVGIRAALRQDPDSIVVGEIRDIETAENAFRTSLTGRLVLSTLHLSDSLSAISRLIDMKVERPMVGYALKGVINQRLVGKLCPHCTVEYRPAEEVVRSLGMSPDERFLHGKGCDECNNTGFYGRSGIFEILPIDETIQRFIIAGEPISKIKQELEGSGFKTLRQDGIRKIRLGQTTAEEVLKKTSSGIGVTL